MMNQIFCLLFLSMNVAIGNAAINNSSLQELCSPGASRDAYVAKVLSDLRTHLSENEPFHLEDDIRQVLRLYNGGLYGLKDFYLKSEPQIGCDEDNAHLSLVFHFNNTKAHYTWNFAGISQVTGGFWTFAKGVAAEIRLSAPLNNNKAVPFVVNNVRVIELDGLWVRVDGVEPFAWIASQIGNLGTMMTRKTLKGFLTNNLKTIFNEVFSQYEL